MVTKSAKPRALPVGSLLRIAAVAALVGAAAAPARADDCASMRVRLYNSQVLLQFWQNILALDNAHVSDDRTEANRAREIADRTHSPFDSETARIAEASYRETLDEIQQAKRRIPQLQTDITGLRTLMSALNCDPGPPPPRLPLPQNANSNQPSDAPSPTDQPPSPPALPPIQVGPDTQIGDNQNQPPTTNVSPGPGPAPLPPPLPPPLLPAFAPDPGAGGLAPVWCVIKRTVTVIPGQNTTQFSVARCDDVPGLGAEWTVVNAGLTFPAANGIRDGLNGANPPAVWCVMRNGTRMTVIRCDNTAGAGPGWILIATNQTLPAANGIAFGTPSPALPPLLPPVIVSVPPTTATGPAVGPGQCQGQCCFPRGQPFCSYGTRKDRQCFALKDTPGTDRCLNTGGLIVDNGGTAPIESPPKCTADLFTDCDPKTKPADHQCCILPRGVSSVRLQSYCGTGAMLSSHGVDLGQTPAEFQQQCQRQGGQITKLIVHADVAPTRPAVVSIPPTVIGPRTPPVLVMPVHPRPPPVLVMPVHPRTPPVLVKPVHPRPPVHWRPVPRIHTVATRRRWPPPHH